MLKPRDDEHFMRMALEEAQKAFDAGEVPVGAIITCKGQVIARAHNLTERLRDFTAHAEMQAFTSASEFLGGKYLDKCTLYVTLEPCVMCGGGAFNTHLGKIVFGASDPKRGYQKFESSDSRITHPKTQVKGGVLEEECAALLVDFFSKRRKKR